jgi:hypothetical protein
MAIFTRTSGDAKGVVHVDAGRLAGNIICTGLTKNPVCLLVTADEDMSAELVTGGAVETILRSIAVDSTIVMYQVNTTSISVLLEATGAGSNVATIDDALQVRIRALGANIGATTSVVATNVVVVNTGFKLTV